MNRRQFFRTAGGIASLTILGAGVAAAHKPGNSEPSQASHRGCHSAEDDLEENPGHKPEDEGDARDPGNKNPEC